MSATRSASASSCSTDACHSGSRRSRSRHTNKGEQRDERRLAARCHRSHAGPARSRWRTFDHAGRVVARCGFGRPHRVRRVNAAYEHKQPDGLEGVMRDRHALGGTAPRPTSGQGLRSTHARSYSNGKPAEHLVDQAAEWPGVPTVDRRVARRLLRHRDHRFRKKPVLAHHLDEHCLPRGSRARSRWPQQLGREPGRERLQPGIAGTARTARAPTRRPNPPPSPCSVR